MFDQYESRNNKIFFRLTDRELDLLNNLSNKDGITVSEFVRKILRKELKKHFKKND